MVAQPKYIKGKFSAHNSQIVSHNPCPFRQHGTSCTEVHITDISIIVNHIIFSDYVILYLDERDAQRDGADDDEVVSGDALDAVDAPRVADVGQERTQPAVTTGADAARVGNLNKIQ